MSLRLIAPHAESSSGPSMVIAEVCGGGSAEWGGQEGGGRCSGGVWVVKGGGSSILDLELLGGGKH